jgi:glycosyltransferase involved in cell wall biosynthesis
VARNTGIEAATGEYLTFVDSDDWLQNEMYEKMVTEINNSSDLDMVMCDSTLFTQDSEMKAADFIRQGYYSKTQIVSELYPVLLVTEDFGKIPIVSVWNCFMKRRVLMHHYIRFDPGLRYGEDYLFMPEVMIHTTSFYYLKGHHLYNYRQYDESRSKKLQPEWWHNFLDLNKKLNDLLADSTEFDFTRQLKLQLIHSALFLTGAIFNNKGLGTGEKLHLLRKLFNEPQLEAAFSNLDFDKQPLPLKVVLYLIKKKMALSYLMYRYMVSTIKI